jgi:hypothetical protein
MDIIHFFSHLTSEVQLVLILGSFTLVLLLACSRSAGENLLVFFQGVLSLLKRHRRQTIKRRIYRASLPSSQRYLEDEQPTRRMLTQKQEYHSRLPHRNGE